MKEKLLKLKPDLETEDISIIAKQVRISESSVKRYLQGNVPDNRAGDIIAEEIIESAKSILEKKNLEQKVKLESI